MSARGHVFASELAGMRRAAGVLATCHRSALTTHLRRIGQRRAMMRARRGSSSWPWLRAEAQRRFAAGESPRGIHDLRASYAPVVHRRQVAGAPRIRRPGPDVPVEVARAGRRRVMRPTEIRDLVAYLTEPQSWRGFSAGHEAPRRGRPALHGHRDWLASRPETLSIENGNTEARRTRITHGAARRGPGGSGRRRRMIQCPASEVPLQSGGCKFPPDLVRGAGSNRLGSCVLAYAHTDKYGAQAAPLSGGFFARQMTKKLLTRDTPTRCARRSGGGEAPALRRVPLRPAPVGCAIPTRPRTARLGARSARA